ncbi:unnamed protein product, partial [Ilex paraguariensis]
EEAFKLELEDEKAKQKAIKVASNLAGVDPIVMDIDEKKLTATGDIDNECPPPMPSYYARVVTNNPRYCVIC